MGSSFDFKQFSVRNEGTGLKVGTDGVLLGALADVQRAEPVFSCADDAKKPRILDVGTGTGIIALMLAQRCPEAEIIGIDIDQKSPAAENFHNSPWSDRLQFVPKSLVDFMDSDPGIFDMIVSNPPYFENSLTCPDPDRSVARHTDSLSYREVITFANDFLAPQGTLSLVLPKGEEQHCTRFAASFGLYPCRVWNIKTTPSKAASRIIMDLAKDRKRPEIKELTLQDRNEYTPEYKELTKEFYLKF